MELLDERDRPVFPGVWTTANEIEFVRGLGTHLQHAPESVEHVPREKRLALLRSYRETMSKRVNWERADPEEVAAEVDRLIALLQTF